MLIIYFVVFRFNLPEPEFFPPWIPQVGLKISNDFSTIELHKITLIALGRAAVVTYDQIANQHAPSSKKNKCIKC